MIDFLEEQGLSWKGDHADTLGKNFVSVLVDCLWYIDGHVHVFEKQSCKFPDFVTQFQGYNKPELSKHRKRVAGNMSASVVEAHSSSLFGCLQSAYWNGSNFQRFKPYVERLAGCLTEYSDKLSSQNKKVKKNHHLPVPVRQLSETLSVSIIKKSGMSYPCYDKLVQILSNLDSYEHTCLSNISPDQSRERYTFINNLKSGLNIPVVMLTYSPGNNCGNLTFLWKYGDNDSVETVFEKKCLCCGSNQTFASSISYKSNKACFVC